MSPAEPTKRVGMNISLTPELARTIQERVDGGLYSSASEVVREALRLLVEKDRPAPSPPIEGSKASNLDTSDWRELRAALLGGESALANERLRDIGELFRAAVLLKRSQLVSEFPSAPSEVIQKHLAQWLRERSGEDVGGDGPGTPVPRERIERILRGA